MIQSRHVSMRLGGVLLTRTSNSSRSYWSPVRVVRAVALASPRCSRLVFVQRPRPPTMDGHQFEEVVARRRGPPGRAIKERDAPRGCPHRPGGLCTRVGCPCPTSCHLRMLPFPSNASIPPPSSPRCYHLLTASTVPFFPPSRLSPRPRHRHALTRSSRRASAARAWGTQRKSRPSSAVSCARCMNGAAASSPTVAREADTACRQCPNTVAKPGDSTASGPHRRQRLLHHNGGEATVPLLGQDAQHANVGGVRVGPTADAFGGHPWARNGRRRRRSTLAPRSCPVVARLPKETTTVRQSDVQIIRS